MYKIEYPRNWAREYESVYILNPDLTKEEAAKISNRINSVIKTQGGKLVEMQVWGKRVLAYPIKKKEKGIIVYIRYIGFPGIVEEVERNFRMIEDVYRFITVKLREKVDIDAIEVDETKIKIDEESYLYEPSEETSEEKVEALEGEAPKVEGPTSSEVNEKEEILQNDLEENNHEDEMR